MKRSLLSGVAAAALATACTAGAAQAQSPHNWTGFYVGLNAGGAWGNSKTTTTVNCGPPLGAYFCDNTGVGAANAAAVNASGSGTITDTAFIGGAQAGYLWQQNAMVYGVETDFNAFHLGGSRQGSGNLPFTYPAGGAVAGTPYTITNSFSTNWLYTLRGRLGWLAQPDMLFYFTGGLAVTKLNVSFAYSDTFPVSGSGSASATKAGWTIGGGLEWALNNHWSVKGEYLYVDFGPVTATGSIGVGYSQNISTSGDLTAHIARLGVNYKF